MRNKKCFLNVLIVFLILLLSCSSNQKELKQADPGQYAKIQNQGPYLIQPGDQLDIKFFYNPELNESVTVRPDGMISLQLIDEVQVSGKAPSQLDEILTEKYAHELRKPMVTVIVRTFSTQRIYVGGEVNEQGLINLSHGMTALQAIFESGGFKETAQPKETIVIRKGADNRPIPIKIDLTAAIDEMGSVGSGADFQLQPSDVVYVPKSAIAKANQWVNQYIERLLLFRGVSLGFTYELRDNVNLNF